MWYVFYVNGARIWSTQKKEEVEQIKKDFYITTIQIDLDGTEHLKICGLRK